jgi:CRP-like cAMP-binding protein
MSPEHLLERAIALLDIHPFPGADARELLTLLQSCSQRSYNPGAVLCQEDDPGVEMFFLLLGEVEVLKRDPKGVDRLLGTIRAPALLGHMSLVDRSARSATCVARGDAVIAALDRQRFNHFFGQPSPEGRALRRLLAASIADQLARGNQRLRVMIDDGEALETEDTVTRDDVTQEEVMALEGQFEGWDVWGPDRKT